jgi:hypothetical protein
MTKFSRTNIGPLSSGLTAIALGTGGVCLFAVVILAMGMGHVPESLMLFLGLELMVSFLMLLVGPICCFFTPLRWSTKAKLFVAGLSLLVWARLEGAGALLALFFSFFCGFCFVYALCDELEATAIKARLNKMVVIGVASPLVALMSGLAESLSPTLAWSGLTLALVMSLLALIGSITVLVSLVQRVRQLQYELPEQDENHTGLSRY